MVAPYTFPQEYADGRTRVDEGDNFLYGLAQTYGLVVLTDRTNNGLRTTTLYTKTPRTVTRSRDEPPAPTQEPTDDESKNGLAARVLRALKLTD